MTAIKDDDFVPCRGRVGQRKYVKQWKTVVPPGRIAAKEVPACGLDMSVPRKVEQGDLGLCLEEFGDVILQSSPINGVGCSSSGE